MKLVVAKVQEVQFWDQFRSGLQVRWDDFEVALTEQLSLLRLTTAEVDILQYILDSSDTGYVLPQKYHALIHGFGPLSLSLYNVTRIFSQKYVILFPVVECLLMIALD